MATTGEVSAEGSALAFPFPFLNKDVLVADALFQRDVISSTYVRYASLCTRCPKQRVASTS